MSPSDGLATSAQEDEWLWGWDPTPGIVSIWADSNGSAIVWRRIGATGELIREEARFRPWLLLDRLDDLHFLGSGLAIDGVADARVTYRELDGPGSLRFLVSASDGRALTKLVLQGAGRRLGPILAIWPSISSIGSSSISKPPASIPIGAGSS